MHSEPVQLLPGPSRVHQGGHAAGLDKGEGPRGQRQQGMSQDDRSRWVVGTNSVVMGVNHFVFCIPACNCERKSDCKSSDFCVNCKCLPAEGNVAG